ncbi:MAG: site-specific DNA-methyltransferase [Candidatus Lokiarchaeota archaeon]|nr:site-specific DNA-methyltransferase [Candidatus Lokiarchaeota archaeon]
MMKFILSDYFAVDLGDGTFDGVIVDNPYKGCMKGKLGEREFSIDAMMRKMDRETKHDSFLINFANEKNIFDLRLFAKDAGWNYATMIIWNKRNARAPPSWNRPLHHTEFVLFFTKGDFRFNFQNGIKGEPYRRSKMGCRLVDSKPNNKTFSLGVFDEIVEFPVPNRKGKHPYMKPPQFSDLFHQILCGQKYDPKTGTPLPPRPEPKVLDPCCGSGSLLRAFPDSVGVDIEDWGIVDGETITWHEGFSSQPADARGSPHQTSLF